MNRRVLCMNRLADVSKRPETERCMGRTAGPGADKDIDKRGGFWYSTKVPCANDTRWCGAMAAQLICNQSVAGSTPVTSSKKVLRYTAEKRRVSWGFCFLGKGTQDCSIKKKSAIILISLKLYTKGWVCYEYKRIGEELD